ncbi:MAG: 2-(1,2-epoxy-1,2-dihydrophenyl)acetyl-CoA isomerase [Sphingobacteriales bacterium]|nr:MAG: 2-(1,2-epoxy-1,2-dihydrophenyl)acetyl-CoA isomerase [Sphingobacteriales bacterium]
MSQTILHEMDGNVAVLRLNRPEKYNSFTREMALRLLELLRQCAADPTVRCVVLTGGGKGFCAGQDLGEAEDPTRVDFAKILDEQYNLLIKEIRMMPKPVITAVNGVAAGAGANLALAGDLVVASEGASFIQAFSKIGLIPDCGGTWFLPRMIGAQRALALMVTGDKVTATEAQQMGMVYKVFPETDFESGWKTLAQTMSKAATQSVAFTKQLIAESFRNTLEQQLEREKELQVAAGTTADFAEGVNAFLQKRAPAFSGN